MKKGRFRHHGEAAFPLSPESASLRRQKAPVWGFFLLQSCFFYGISSSCYQR